MNKKLYAVYKKGRLKWFETPSGDKPTFLNEFEIKSNVSTSATLITLEQSIIDTGWELCEIKIIKAKPCKQKRPSKTD